MTKTYKAIIKALTYNCVYDNCDQCTAVKALIAAETVVSIQDTSGSNYLTINDNYAFERDNLTLKMIPDKKRTLTRKVL